MRTIRRVLLVAALIGAGYVGFRWGPAVFPRVEQVLGIDGTSEAAGVPASPELADATLDRFERFRRGDDGDRLVLGDAELTSLVRYSLPGILPPGVQDAEVSMSEGQVSVSARVALASFPRLPDLGSVVGLLPDTVTIEVRGTLVPHDQGHLALLVDRVRAGKVPIPTRMVGDVLDGLGGDRPATLPRDGLPVPLPDGIGSVFVQRDSLVLLSKTAGGN